MASLNKLFPNPCNLIGTLQWFWVEVDFLLQKQHLAAILDFSLFEFFKFIKMSRRGPKIVHPDHPLIQLLGPPAPESIPDLRDYNIPLDYGKKTSYS